VADIFISYAREDRAVAYVLAEALEMFTPTIHASLSALLSSLVNCSSSS
jgi:hypothetical protein